MANEGLRPFPSVPRNIREWDRWCRQQQIQADDDSVATATIQDEAVTYAKIQEVAADRILGRLATAGVVTELTAADLVSLLEAENWTFAGTVQFDSNIGFFGTTPISQPANITDAETAHALSATFSDTEVEAALDALGSKINQILTMVESLGLTA